MSRRLWSHWCRESKLACGLDVAFFMPVAISASHHIYIIYLRTIHYIYEHAMRYRDINKWHHHHDTTDSKDTAPHFTR